MILGPGQKKDRINLEHVMVPESKKVLKKDWGALAGVAQWTECRPANQRVSGSVPSQGTCLGCRPGPQ